RISPSTAYDYDTSIPLVFNGKWFQKQNNGTEVYQQHIAPTLAKVMGISKPSGSTVDALPILTQEKSKPDIVVVTVIDQGGMGLINTHKSVAPRIQALMASSANFTNAHVGHLDAHTAVGHMAIGTGAFPIKSSVIGNTFFRMKKENGKNTLLQDEIYAGKDESKVDTTELKAETLGDVLNRENKGNSVLASQSYALRASIGMGGHGALGLTQNAKEIAANSFIYWLNSSESRWITDTRYYSLPKVAAASDVLLAYLKYYPKGYEGYSIRDKKDAHKNWGVIMATPAETQLEGELMRAVIREEILNKKKNHDGFTDLIYISFKSADAVGHQFGYHSLQARETLAAIDGQIGAMQDFLTKEYGDNYVLVLTADHGCAPVSEISGGARLTIEEIYAAVDALLPQDVAAKESLINFATVGQISLNHALMQQYNIPLEKIRTTILNLRPQGRTFFKEILTRKDLGVDN
ncbi:MAG TPA: alkaline phosphatase family protein, partial [Turneriella sp.]|nr:alkaline phosphatase family protein [Turneriella sp.]